MTTPRWLNNHDYSQLIGMLKACEKIEREINELNRQKTNFMRAANACGFDRVAIRELLRLRRKGKVPDDHIPSIYEGLTRRIRATQFSLRREGFDDDEYGPDN